MYASIIHKTTNGEPSRECCSDRKHILYILYGRFRINMEFSVQISSVILIKCQCTNCLEWDSMGDLKLRFDG